MEPAAANGSVHTGQHQRICAQSYVLASSVDWAEIPGDSRLDHNDNGGNYPRCWFVAQSE